MLDILEMQIEQEIKELEIEIKTIENYLKATRHSIEGIERIRDNYILITKEELLKSKETYLEMIIGVKGMNNSCKCQNE